MLGHDASSQTVTRLFFFTISLVNLNELDVSTVLEHVKKNLNQF